MWGKQLPIMIDVLVLGNSLLEHNTKASKLLCLNDDTRDMKIARLTRAFWSTVDVSHTELPKHLQGSEQKRLQGVYSKLQTMKIFASGENKQHRILVVDADLLFRRNIDDVFSVNAPAAVMRGECDTCLIHRRPGHSYFYGDVRSGSRNQPMKGGINGGMVLLEPSEEAYREMMEELAKFDPWTAMAEQEFLSWYFGRTAEWNAIHKKHNFQIHQLFLSTPTPPPGQERESSFQNMVNDPQEIRVFHFSADRKPSHILLEDMESVQGWSALPVHLKNLEQHMHDQHASRNPEIWKYPEWLNKVDKLQEEAHYEWFEAWKRTYKNLTQFVVASACDVIIEPYGGPPAGYFCGACQQYWHLQDLEANPNIIRDHLLFNCASMAASVCIPVEHMTNLSTMLFVPCGSQVESKLLYLSEVYQFFDKYGSVCGKDYFDLAFDWDRHPDITLPNYTIPQSILAITEDQGKDAAYADPDEPDLAIAQHWERYDNAIQQIQCFHDYDWRTNQISPEDWSGAVHDAFASFCWLRKYEVILRTRAQMKAPSMAVSSSSSLERSSQGGSSSSTTEPTTSHLPAGNHPWRAKAPAIAKHNPHLKKKWQPKYLCPPPPPPPKK